MNYCCENCGWSEIVGSPIMCHYHGYRTWRDECCAAWKPKEKETNMVEVVRCKDCKHWNKSTGHCPYNSIFTVDNWFCADGERQDDDD